MSPIYLIIALIVIAFACAFGLCEWAVRRPRDSRDEDRSPRG
jgi:hypothetical protein